MYEPHEIVIAGEINDVQRAKVAALPPREFKTVCDAVEFFAEMGITLKPQGPKGNN